MKTSLKNQPPSEPDKAQEPDDPLMQLLLRKAATEGLTLKRLAAHLGISYERLTQLRAHPRPFAHTRREVLEKVGAFLQMPMVLVLCFAGLFRLEDFVWPDTGSRTGRVAEALAALRDDPVLGPLAPRELDDAEGAVKLFVLFLYEQLRSQPDAQRRISAWVVELEHATVQVSREPRAPAVKRKPGRLFT